MYQRYYRGLRPQNRPLRSNAVALILVTMALQSFFEIVPGPHVQLRDVLRQLQVLMRAHLVHVQVQMTALTGNALTIS